ncbi:Ig-like domain-containing protein [Leptothermofonsia sp. ETS-13]|uniref:Ig-like domain-containing protein n=1 Tax=Leptothermofonsia sp. ETS-13 TaxID=3035696 RepID=UPI003B9DF7FE
MQYLCSTIRLALLSSMFGAIALSAAASAQTNLPTSTSEPIQFAQPASTEVKILAPQATSTGEQTTNLMVQYASGATVQVTVNGNPLGAQIPTQVQPDSAGGVVNQVWYGILLKLGENILTVQAAGGSPVSVKVTVRETAYKLQFLPTSAPRIPADGRSTVTVEGQIVDEAGNPVTQDAVVTLTASAGTFTGADQDRDRPGFQVLANGGKFTAQLQSSLAPQKVRIRAAAELRELREVKPGETLKPLPPIQVSNDGPSSSPSLVTPSPLTPITLPVTNQLAAYTQVEFITNLRPFLVSGAVTFRLGAGGTDFYGSFRDFLNPDRIDQDVRFDASINAFATGRIGEWLVTAAFNNQRPLNEICDGTTRLFRDPQFCDQVYPVYGDSSTTDYLTPSIDSVYVRFERNSPIVGAGTDYFMWGDYSTPEFATASQLFTATTRQIHGFKGNYNLGNLQITAMYGDNLQGFQRDTIAPNGTSGYYFLSRRLVVGGSETVYVETQEIGRPGTVVERKQLFRGPDYEIDYDRGSLLFRRPIQQVEFDPFGRSLVRQVVVTYQYDGTNTGDTHLFAGRLQYNFSREFGRESWAAFSYLREDEGDRDYELYGVDAFIPFGKDGRLIAEIARSTNDSIFFGNVGGNAYRFEVSGTLFEGVIGRAYYRSVDEDFTNNATFSFFPGQTRYGAELAAKVGPTTKLQFQIDHESNYGIAPSTLNAFTTLFDPLPEAIPGERVDNSLTSIRAGVLQKLGAANLSLEWVNRSRADSVAGRLTEDSNQIVSRLTYPLTDTLVFRAQNEQNIGSSGDPLYPSRTTVGLDWAAYPGLTLRLAQQFISTTSIYRANSITSLDAIFDQKLTEDTTLTGRYSILNGVGGWGSQAAFGLNHRITLAPGLRVVLGYERIYGDIFAYTGTGQQFAQAYAVGQSASALGITEGDAYSIGIDYTDNPNFKASGRFEYRTTDLGNNLVISVAGAGKLSPSLTALARYQQANFANQTLQAVSGDSINLKFGLAYRNPFDDKFNALLRYEFRQNPSFTPDSILFGTGTGSNAHIVALEAIYTPNWRWEFYGKFGLRSSRSYLARDLVGTNAITLGQFRALYRLGYRWDIGGEVRYISQSLTGYNEVGFAVEAGYYVTPNIRMAAGYSFGRANDRDLGDRSKGGPYVLFTLKLNELFEGFGLQRAFPENAQPKIAPPQQQESLVQPVATQPGSTVSPPETGPASRGQGQ